jgi:hypothetical protein
MRENVGNTERLFRIGIGASLAAVGLSRVKNGGLGPALLFASGALVLESGLTRVCPVNALLGIDSREDQPAGIPFTGRDALESTASRA